MNGHKSLELLFQYASEYKFHDFTKSFLESASYLHPSELGDAYLMQSQIKLFSADETLLEDLEQAERYEAAPRFPCLKDQWIPDSPNRFVVFKRTRDALRDFLQSLPQVGEKMRHWYGEAGVGMVRQMQSEILYFCGNFNEALRLAKEQGEASQRHCADDISSQYVQFRCYLAMGSNKEAERCMLDMIRSANAHPECLRPYLIVRDWANLTTGWSGDNPRFSEIPNGEMLPVLEDRLTAIRKGISRLSLSEEPFVEYAKYRYKEVCTMREHYMDIFHAIYWFQVGDTRQALAHFMRAYRVSSASGLVMPFAEYGKQIVSFLRYVRDSGTTCSHDWIAMTVSLAERYEESLRAYRD